MARCTRNYSLEIHHICRDGGNGLDNAQVLCQMCHEATATYGSPLNRASLSSPPPFDEATKQAAHRRAGYRCECTRTSGCH